MKNKQATTLLEEVKLKIAISNFQKEERKMPKKNWVKIVAMFLIGMGITLGATYAGIQWKKLFKIEGIDDQGIQTAIENEYIQNFDMEYIEKEKVKFKVDYFMMDDINFDLVFNFITEDPVDNYEGIAISNLKITDEQENQIYFPGENQEIWSKNIAVMGEWWSVVEKQDHLLRQVVHLTSNHFPRSQKIYVSFDEVILYNVNKGNPITIKYPDNYQLEFDVSKQLSNRKTILYQPKDSIEGMKDIKLTNSGLALTIKTNAYIGKDEDYKIIDEAGKEYSLSETLPVIDTEKMDYKQDEQILKFNFTLYQECDSLTLKMPNGKSIELIKQ